MKKRAFCSMLALCAMVFGCEKPNDVTSQNDDGAVDFKPALPQMAPNDANCPDGPTTDQSSALELFCFDFATKETFTFGRIDEIKAVVAPAFAMLDNYPQVDDCAPINIAPALDITLSNVEVMSGNLSEKTFTIRIPAGTMSTWSPSPRIADDGQLVWMSDGEEVATGLATGMVIGGGFWRDPAIGHFTTLRSQLIEVRDGKLLRQQVNHDQECGTSPEREEALAMRNVETLDELRANLAQCGSLLEPMETLPFITDQLNDPRQAHGAHCWQPE